MKVEHALLRISADAAAGFEASMARALPIIESARGCHGAEVRRQVEDPSVYLLLVRWESVEAHLAFRESDLFESWRTLTHLWYVEVPQVSHFSAPIERA